MVRVVPGYVLSERLQRALTGLVRREGVAGSLRKRVAVASRWSAWWAGPGCRRSDVVAAG